MMALEEYVERQGEPLRVERLSALVEHEQVDECRHKGQHMTTDCGIFTPEFVDYLHVESIEGEEGPEDPVPQVPVEQALEEAAGEIEGLMDPGPPTEEWAESPNLSQIKSTNPKDILARQEARVLMHLIPRPGLIHTALAFMDGARKYGPYNWREEGVAAGTYLSAAERHIADYLDREKDAPDSGVHHLGHAVACLLIIMDAEACENLVDDRPPPAPTSQMMEEYKEKGALDG